MAGKKDVDLERCMTASANQRTDSHASSTSKATRHYPIAVQNSSGKAILINVTVKEVNGHLVLNSAWDQISQALGENWYQRLARRLLMNIIVGTAKVRQVRSIVSFPSSRHFPMADIPCKSSYTSKHKPLLRHHTNHLHHHLASSSKTSPPTPSSPKPSTTRTYSSTRNGPLSTSAN